MDKLFYSSSLNQSVLGGNTPTTLKNSSTNIMNNEYNSKIQSNSHYNTFPSINENTKNNYNNNNNNNNSSNLNNNTSFNTMNQNNANINGNNSNVNGNGNNNNNCRVIRVVLRKKKKQGKNQSTNEEGKKSHPYLSHLMNSGTSDMIKNNKVDTNHDALLFDGNPTSLDEIQNSLFNNHSNNINNNNSNDDLIDNDEFEASLNKTLFNHEKNLSHNLSTSNMDNPNAIGSSDFISDIERRNDQYSTNGNMSNKYLNVNNINAINSISNFQNENINYNNNMEISPSFENLEKDSSESTNGKNNKRGRNQRNLLNSPRKNNNNHNSNQQQQQQQLHQKKPSESTSTMNPMNQMNQMIPNNNNNNNNHMNSGNRNSVSPYGSTTNMLNHNQTNPNSSYYANNNAMIQNGGTSGGSGYMQGSNAFPSNYFRYPDMEKKIGKYTMAQRREKILKYRGKRKIISSNKLRYPVRKKIAETRPRIKGRFVSKKGDEEDDQMNTILTPTSEKENANENKSSES